MAQVLVLTAEQKLAALKAGDSELKFLMNKEGVSEDLQAQFMHSGVTSVRLLSAFAKDEAELTQLVADYFGVKQSDGIPQRVMVAKLMLAFTSAKTRTQEATKHESALEARHLPKEISNNACNGMRGAFESKWWPLEDEQVPSRAWIERKLNEVETQVYRAEPLTEAVRMTDEDPGNLKATWTHEGGMELTKTGTKAPLPRNQEELRERVILLGTAWMLVAFQQTQRPWLQGLTPQLFQEYLSYLLGRYVFGLTAKTDTGREFASPSWELLLAYEQAVRVKAMKLVKAGGTLRDSLRAAWEDLVTRDPNFTSVLALETKERPRAADNAAPPAAPAGSAKGAGKSRKQKRQEQNDKRLAKKGKGKGKGASLECKSVTDAGERICFKYNSSAGCHQKGCTFKHVCGKCFGNHPLTTCLTA